MGVNMTKMILIYGCFIGINALASCIGAQDRLSGKWQLIGYSFSPSRDFPIKKNTIFLTITDNKRIGGNSGCNIFGGDIIVLSAGKIKIGSLTSTERYCDEITGEFESLFTDTLQNATEYSLTDGLLTFTSREKKSSLSFAPAAVGYSTIPDENHEIFFVRNKLVDCGAVGTSCLQVKKDKGSAWYEMPQPIAGFSFKPGRFYKIEVKQAPLDQTPGKVRVQQYQLVWVIKTVKSEKDLY
jgi:heat shock protein HslJ